MKLSIVLVVMLAWAAPLLAQQQPLPLPPIEAGQSSNALRVVDPPREKVTTPSPPHREGQPHVDTPPPLETLPPGVPTVGDPLPAPHHLTLPGIPANAQIRAMTLDELESIAVANNPAIANAYAAVQAAQGRWKQAGLPPNPHIGYSGVEIGDHHAAGQQGGYIEQEFVRGGKLRLSRNVAAQDVSRAQQQLVADRMRVMNDVRIAYYEVLVLQLKLDIVRRLHDIAQQALSTSDKLFQAQEVSRADVLQARVEFNHAKIVEQNTVNAYDAAWRRLTAVVGVPQLQRAPLSGNLEDIPPEITWEQAIAHLMGGSPEIGAARANLQRAQWALSRARAEPIANLNVQATVQHDNSSTDDIVGVQATFPLAIFDRNQGGIFQAESELTMARGQLRRLELSLQERLAGVFERYASARQQVARYRGEMLPDALASLKLVGEGYRQGEFSYLSLLTAQRTYVHTQMFYFDALRELQESTVELNGMLLRDSLQSQGAAAPESASSIPDINSLITPPPY